MSAELTFSLPPERVQEPAPQEQRERRKDRRKKVDIHIWNDLFHDVLVKLTNERQVTLEFMNIKRNL